MLEQMQTHERRNIRPYILGLCFTVGLVFGFIFYVATPSFATVQVGQEEQAREEQQKAEAAAAQKGPEVQLAPEMQAIKPVVNDNVNLPVVPVDDISKDLPKTPPTEDMRKIPDSMTVAINYETGLTGKTTYRPLAPVKLDTPAPTVDFTPRKPTPGGKPVNVNEVPLPELDE